VRTIKKILLVGFFSEKSDFCTYATSFHSALCQLGYDVKKFDYRRRCRFLLDFLLKSECARYKPDLIFFIKAEKIYWKTIRYLKNKSGAIIINFYPDNPFTFWNGNSNANVLNSLSFFDFFLIWSEKLIPILNSAGARRVLYFPFAFDGQIFNNQIKISEQYSKQFSSDVSFVGSWDEQRQRWLEKLLEKLPKIQLAVWGDRWLDNLSKSSCLRNYVKGPAVYGNEMIKIYKSSKIILNFIRRQNLDAHNMRTFEIPACGAFMLTQYTDDQAKFLFKEGYSVQCFKNVDELVNKINLFLHNDELRLECAQNSFLVAQQYALDKQLIKLFKKISF
jgi:spore maturation protein CgeB